MRLVLGPDEERLRAEALADVDAKALRLREAIRPAALAVVDAERERLAWARPDDPESLVVVTAAEDTRRAMMEVEAVRLRLKRQLRAAKGVQELRWLIREAALPETWP